MTMRAPQNRKFDKLSEIDHESQSALTANMAQNVTQATIDWRDAIFQRVFLKPRSLFV